MKNTWKWIIGVVVVLVLLFVLPFVFRGTFGYGGMMGGYGVWGHPMMSGYGFSPFGGLFMGIGMLFVWAIPLGLLGLVVYGATRLANKPGTPAASQTCASCKKLVQADWKNCPHCGTGL